MSEPQQPVFSIEKIYIKDLSLELPGAPQVFLQSAQPQLEVQIANAANGVAEGLYEVALTVTVAAKSGEKTFFLAEVVQCGLFQIRNVPAPELDPVLGIACPNILFPYAREAIADVVGRGGFPPVHLAPVNFEAIYQQRHAAAETQPAPRIEIAH